MSDFEALVCGLAELCAEHEEEAQRLVLNAARMAGRVAVVNLEQRKQTEFAARLIEENAALRVMFNRLVKAWEENPAVGAPFFALVLKTLEEFKAMGGVIGGES